MKNENIENCLYCEKSLKHGQNFYCSRSCKMRHNNPNPHKKKIKKICATCNKYFYVLPSLQRIRFCSYRCRRHTTATKEKISILKIFYFKNNPHPRGMLGKLAWNKGLKGTHFSPKTEFKAGKDSVFWKGGISKEPYPFEFTKDLKLYIKHIYRACLICGISKNLSVHHIDYNKDNINLNNLIPLCKSCHSKTNYNRNRWIKFLKTKVIFDKKVLANASKFSFSKDFIKKYEL
ncbi:MAG: HNH endonuclease [Patescibacteria group bacterium]